MKKFLLIVIPLLLLVLYVSNPSEAEFKEYAKENYAEIIAKSNSTSENELLDVVNSVLHTLNDGRVINVKRENYYLFSSYEMASPEIGQLNKVKFIGVFRLFVKIG